MNTTIRRTLAAWLLCLAAFGFAVGTQAATVLVDFNNSTVTNLTLNPAGGLYYNNATLTGSQSVMGAVTNNGTTAPMSLVDTANAASGWWLVLTKTNGSGGVGASGAGANYYGPYPAAVGNFAITALEDGIFVNNGAVLLVAITNLDNSRTYDLLTYGARGNTGSSEPYALAIGQSASPGTVTFNSLNNASVAPAWTNIVPAGGQIGFTLNCIGTSGVTMALNFLQLVGHAVTPSFEPPGGSYTSPQSVTLTAEAGSTIYYTTDGTDPTTSGTRSSGPSPVTGIPVPMPTNLTLKAYAALAGSGDSAVATATYITSATLPAATPTFTPPAGSYIGAQSVTIASDPGSRIFYTTDGSAPSMLSSNGASPIMVTIPAPTNLTLKAYATNSGYSDSAVATAAYVTELAPSMINIAFHSDSTTANAMPANVAPLAQGTVVNTASDFWNNIINTGGVGTNFSGVVLKDAAGADSGARLSGLSGYTGTSGNGWSTKNKDYVMMEGWYGIKGTEFFTISNLPAAFSTNSGGYRVIIFGDSNDSNSRVMNYVINGVTNTVVDSGTFAADFTSWQTEFSGLTNSTITIWGNSAAMSRSAVNGIQVTTRPAMRKPQVLEFRAAPGYLTNAGPSTLYWQVTNAESVLIVPGIGNVTALTTNGVGSLAVSVSSNTTYILTASLGTNSITATNHIHIGPAVPNILFFLVDDMGWQDCSLPFYYSNGVPVRTTLNQTYRTPNLETLATRGLRFPNACAHTVCSPSRVSLMTGMTAARHRVTNWTYPTVPQQTDNANATLGPPANWRIAGMDSTDKPFPRLLQEAGYRTIHSGKAHFGPQFQSGGVALNPSGDPRFLGFDVNIAGWGAGGPGSYLSENSYGTDPLWHVPGLEAYYTPTQTHTHLTEALTLEINKAITQSVADGVPFFGYMSHYAIHAPYEIDTRFTNNYPGLTGTILGHATLIEGMDKSLGDILQKLDDLGVAENTLVFFMGDNGAESPNTGTMPNPSAPLRSRKGTPYEGGTRVPFLVAWAKTNAANPFQARIPVPKNTHQDDIITINDMFPTLLDIAGVGYTNSTDGTSLLPYFQGISGYHRPQEFIVHFPHAHSDVFYSTLRQDNWKLIHRYVTRAWEMYDLSSDIGESTNLALSPTPANSVRLMQMARHLARELSRFGAQWPIEDATGLNRPILMPNLPTVDSDGDGIPDMQEDGNRNGLVDAGETDADNPDTDGDGTPDGAEVMLGTNPLDPKSRFTLQTAAPSAGNVELSWPSTTNVMFQIQQTPTLAPADWSVVADNISGQAGTSHWTMPLTNTGGGAFFRINIK